jgi:hypothetical protein
MIMRRLRVALLPMPGQAIGLALLVAVLAAVLVSAPLMVGSAEEAAWRQERERLSETAVGTTLLSSTVVGRQVSSAGRVARVAELDAAVRDGVQQAGLETPQLLTRLRDPLLAETPRGPEQLQLVFRTGAEEHVDVVAGEVSADGVLVPRTLAETLALAPGATLSARDEDGVPVTVTVSGVYEDLVAPLPEYWRPAGYLYLPYWDPRSGDLVHPPDVLLASRDLALGTAAGAEEDLFLEWFLPLRTGISVEEARGAVADVERMALTMASPESPVTRLVREEGYERPLPRTTLPQALENVDRTVALLEPPVQAVGVGGGAAALVLVGAWAGHRVRRRDDELRALVTRGLSPARGAAQAAREALLPVLLGLAAGGAAGWLLVRRFGPGPDLPADALGQSLAVLAAGGLAALAVLAAVTAALVTRFDSIGSGQAAHALGRVPWLAVTAVVAVVVTVPLLVGDPDPDSGGIDLLTLTAPLLVTAVAAGAVTALLPRLGRRTDAWLHRLTPAPFLAARRVLASHGAARLVVVTTALSLGLVVYAGALADSTERTIDAKASVATGSDVVVPLQRGSASGGPLPAGAMVVGTDEDVTLTPGDLPASALAVRPEQVADVVRWNGALAEAPLAELMGALAGYDGDRVPVLLAGPVPDAVVEATDGDLTLDFRYYSVPVEVVGRADAFPGQGSVRPLVIADWDRYVAALTDANRDPGLVITREAWVRGEPDAAVRTLTEAGYAIPENVDVATSAEFTARPELNAQTWALSYLRAVTLAAGVLGLVGVGMHAVAQQRRRTVAALLLTRMGMSRRSSDTSAGLEIGLLAGVAALVAVAVALPSSALVLRLLDPVPSLRPGPVFDVPWGSIAAVVAGVALVTVLGAVLVGRTARRATGGQVLRDAT